MSNMVLPILVGAALGSSVGIGGIYAISPPAGPAAPYDTLAFERLNARLDELVALQHQQLIGTDRQIMLGRMMVRATTGSDPLPILQQSGK